MKRVKLSEEMDAQPPRYVVWSTDTIDMCDPFQRRWYVRQVLLHGRAADIRALDLDEIARLLPELDLPPHIDGLWRAYLEHVHA
jgi:glycine/D-amino acid oxidase-like deaminating enzyme